MPAHHVEATFAASPAAVLAALTSRVATEGWTLTGIGGFGSVVTWTSFDAGLELVTLRAEIAPVPGLAGRTRLLVHRVDLALDGALDGVLDGVPTPAPVQPSRPCATG